MATRVYTKKREFGTDVVVQGLSDLQKQLQSLPVKIEKNVMRAALREGVKVMEPVAKSLVPSDSGALRDSIRIKTKVNKRTGYINVRLVAGNADAYYAHIVEFGAGIFFVGQRKKRHANKWLREHPSWGRKPRPFMRRAFDETNAAALAATVRYMQDRIPKEMRKEVRRIGKVQTL